MTALNLTPDEALALADQWCAGLTMDADSKGWGAILLVLAEEVRRLRMELAHEEQRVADMMDAVNRVGHEIERLREQLRLAVIDQAIAEAEANDVRCMAEDAARYRWLKKSAFCNVWERGDGIALVVPRAAMSDIDSRIDAAMEATNAG